MASESAFSDATTGSTLYPVMNLMSSMANTFVGSAMAIVIVAPVLLTGRMLYLRATSAATSLRTAGSISKCERLIDGTPNWIGHGDRDRGARLVDGKNVVLTRDVGRDELEDRRIDLEVREVDRRNAELDRPWRS